MVNDADKYRDEDEKQRERVSSKNALESYCFNMKQTVEEEKVKDKISEKDRNTVLEKCNDTIKWLDANHLAEKEEFDHKLKEIEDICKPVVTKLYGGAAAGGAPGAAGGAPPRGGPGGPTIEEVD